MLKKIILILILMFLIVSFVFSQGGTYTTYGYFYLPTYYNYGAQGMVEYDEYNAAMEATDNQIEANKSALTVSGATAFNNTSPTSWTDLDLSSIVGANSAMVIFSFEDSGDNNFGIRMNGDTEEYYNEATYGVATGYQKSGSILVLICVTDTSGVIEWRAKNASTTVVKVIAFIK